MQKNFRTIVQKLSNTSIGTLGKRQIDVVIKSNIEQALHSKEYTKLCEVNRRYHALFITKTQKEMSDMVKLSYANREELFKLICSYVKGLLNSPDALTKQAAEKVFRVLNAFGSNIYRERIADQTIHYIRIIEMLNANEMTTSIEKLQLTDRIAALDAVQREYESNYTGRGDTQTDAIYPSALRKELVEAIITHYEETCWLAKQNETAEWNQLVANLEKRLSEINTSRSSTTDSTAPAEQNLKTA